MKAPASTTKQLRRSLVELGRTGGSFNLANLLADPALGDYESTTSHALLALAKSL